MFAFYLLGAGFSRPAGLPLGNELFADVMNLMKENDPELYNNFVKRDIDEFRLFQRRTTGKSGKTIDLEEFITFLDVAHGLGFKGRNHWSSAGNESQLILRNFIALVLHEAQLNMSQQAHELYDRFAQHLQPDVTIEHNCAFSRILRVASAVAIEASVRTARSQVDTRYVDRQGNCDGVNIAALRSLIVTLMSVICIASPSCLSLPPIVG